jgi:integrase
VCAALIRVSCGRVARRAPGGPRERLSPALTPGQRRRRHRLDAISIRFDGGAAGATTIARKRSVFANVLRYAVELGELLSNPLDRLSWKPPKVSEVIDRRVVVNPRQAREPLTAVTYVGHQAPSRYSRGHRLMALFACMYFAALRPAEAVALRRQDCYLPGDGWGRLTLEKSRPRSTGVGPTPNRS